MCNELHFTCYASWTIPLETFAFAATYKTESFIILRTVAKKQESSHPKNIGYFATMFTMQSISETTWFPSFELDLSRRQPVLTWNFTFMLSFTIADDHTWPELDPWLFVFHSYGRATIIPERPYDVWQEDNVEDDDKKNRDSEEPGMALKVNPYISIDKYFLVSFGLWLDIWMHC